jgi:L-lactate dehydrogenase complex protein LldG
LPVFFLAIPLDTRNTSDARSAILGAIREGLAAGAVPKPFPEVDAVPLGSVLNQPQGGLEESFAEAFSALGGRFVFCADETELLQNLQALTESREWKQVLCTETELLEALEVQGVQLLPADEPIENADACITGCEKLVARTGSIVLSSRQPFGRTATVYYPVHIVVAYTSQVVGDIEDGLNAVINDGSKLPSMIHLNTGPSRTADIEKTLVVGVHGPGEVFVFLVND